MAEQEETIRHLMEQLDASDTTTRRKQIIEQLTLLGAPAVEPLIAYLKRADEYSWLHAIVALGKIGDSRAVGPLVSLLDTADVTPSALIIRALGQIGDAQVVEPLLSVLENVEQRADQEANRIVARDYKGLRDVLWRFLGRSYRRNIKTIIHESTRIIFYCECAFALGQIGDSRAIAPLKQHLNDSDARIREAMRNALIKLKVA